MTPATHSKSNGSIGKQEADAAEREQYRRERAARLARENEHLRAERVRLERLLGVVLQVAVGSTGVDPLVLLEAVAELLGEQLDRPAHLIERERRQVAA